MMMLTRYVMKAPLRQRILPKYGDVKRDEGGTYQEKGRVSRRLLQNTDRWSTVFIITPEVTEARSWRTEDCKMQIAI